MGKTITEDDIECEIENFVVNAWWEEDAEIPQKYADLWFSGARSKFEYQAKDLDCKCPDATGRGLCGKCHKLNLTFVRKA